MTERERFASDHAIDIDRVHVMARVARDCKRLNEHASNGDPHPRNPEPSDKNRNAKLWEHDLGVATNELLRYVQAYGFTAVEYTGLRPCLKRGDRFVEIPA